MKYYIAVAGILSILYSCNNSTSVHHEDDVRVKVKTKDGLHLDYAILGTGDTTLLFLHGWNINKSYWDNQVEYFSPRYKTVTLDLPGFGNSDTSRIDYTIEQYASDVVETIRQLSLKNVVLIGHSMSGDIILETAVNDPEEIIGLIGIDNFNSTGREMTAEDEKYLNDFFISMHQDFNGTVRTYADQSLFHATTDSTVRERVKNDFSGTSKRIAENTLRNLFLYVPREKEQLKKLKHKLYLLNSDANTTDTAALMQNTGASYQLFSIHATGHYPMIEKPAEFNSILQEVLHSISLKD